MQLGGKLRKVEFWKSLANTFPPDDIVWIVDAWDTTLQRGPKYAAMLYTRFENYHGVRGLVVAGAETNCELPSASQSDGDIRPVILSECVAILLQTVIEEHQFLYNFSIIDAFARTIIAPWRHRPERDALMVTLSGKYFVWDAQVGRSRIWSSSLGHVIVNVAAGASASVNR